MAKSYQVSVGSTMYDMNELYSVRIHQPLFDKFSVGNTCSQELEIVFQPGVTPPQMAQITPYYMDPDEGAASFTQIGVYYTDVREVDPYGKTTITAYDSMLKAEQPFNTGGDIGQWPRTMDVVAQQIATAMGITIDPRTSVTPYQIEYPNEYTMRDVLGYIAAANGGNWIITAADQLLLVPLFSSMPASNGYLVDGKTGQPFLFGNTRILV